MFSKIDTSLEEKIVRRTIWGSARGSSFMVKSQKATNRVIVSIKSYIENKLGLIVNVEKSKVARPNQIKYLGFGFYNKNGIWRTKPHLKSVQKFENKLKEITGRSNAKPIDEIITCLIKL